MRRPGDAKTAGEHLVQFYDTESELASTVVPYLAAGLDDGDCVVVIATEPHRMAFERQLRAMAAPLGAAIAAGTYMTIDADGILRYLKGEDGEISAGDFDATIGKLVRRLLDTGRSLRAYGEIVALMWERDDAAGAIALEAKWNELQRQHSFTLFCGYPVIEERLEVVKQVCCSHSFVLPAVAEPDVQPDPGELSAEFAATIDAPRRVRALLRSALAELGFDDDLTERLTLAGSELAANAVLHARTPFRLLVRPRRASVLIAVEDRRPLQDRLEVVGRTPHGLGLVAALALRWGVTPRKPGKLVWAEIPH